MGLTDKICQRCFGLCDFGVVACDPCLVASGIDPGKVKAPDSPRARSVQAELKEAFLFGGLTSRTPPTPEQVQTKERYEHDCPHANEPEDNREHCEDCYATRCKNCHRVCWCEL